MLATQGSPLSMKTDWMFASLPMPSSSQVPGEVYVILHAIEYKCYRIWQNDIVIKFPNPTGSHSPSLSSIKDLNNMFPVLWKLLQPSIKRVAFLPSVHDLTLFSSWRLCLEMKFLFKCILRAARHMSLRNWTQLRTQNRKWSTICQMILPGLGATKVFEWHFGWNIARESSPAPFLYSGSGHISFPLCQLKYDPPANPSDSVTIIHYVQNLCFSTSWWHLKTSLPSLSTWNRQKAQIKPKAQQCAKKNQITFISCFDMVSSKIRLSHLNAKRLR